MRGANLLHLTDSPGQKRQRAADLTRVGADDGVLLFRRRSVINDHHNLPGLWGEHVARDVNDVDDVQPRDIDGADAAAVEVVRVEGEALPSVRIFTDPAGAEHATRARLQQRPP